MGPLIPLTLFGWIPVVLIAFSILPPRRAVIAAYLVAWLFLPVAGYNLQGFTDYNKITATTIGVMLGIVIFDPDRLRAFRPSWLDLPILIFCISPFFSSIANNLGARDGVSGALYKSLTWGLPWLTGRLYFCSLQGARDLAKAVVLGGLVYVPLCLWEIRMSPHLHTNVYGFMQHGFGQTRRGGGFRPMVFMNHGLMLSLFMATTALCAFQLWFSRTVKGLFGLPISWIALVLVATTVLCKSSGATLLLFGACAVMYCAKRWQWSWPVFLMIVGPGLWVATRVSGAWDGQEAIEFAQMISDDRAGSMKFRIDAENLLAEHAMHRPLFGWGTWGRNFIPDGPDSDRMVVADGLWILTFGTQGLVGVLSLFLAGLLPVFVFARRYPPRVWHEPAVSGAAVLAVAVTIYMIDNVVNAMVNPIFMLMAGGIAGTALRRKPLVKHTAPDRIKVSVPAHAHP